MSSEAGGACMVAGGRDVTDGVDRPSAATRGAEPGTGRRTIGRDAQRERVYTRGSLGALTDTHIPRH